MGTSLRDHEVEALQAELEHFRCERERIRGVLGCVGGTVGTVGDRIVNSVFVAGLLFVFGVWVARGILPEPIAIPPMLSLELGVLFVSLKIVWMIHRQTKVEHFQFWILSSIEFRLDSMARQLSEIGEQLSGEADGSAESGRAGRATGERRT
jgi:hypothetical protein